MLGSAHCTGQDLNCNSSCVAATHLKLRCCSGAEIMTSSNNVLMHTTFGKRHLFLQDSEACSYNLHLQLHKTNSTVVRTCHITVMTPKSAVILRPSLLFHNCPELLQHVLVLGWSWHIMYTTINKELACLLTKCLTRDIIENFICALHKGHSAVYIRVTCVGSASHIQEWWY